MRKTIRDGKVAVLYSPAYGAGWFTWNTDNKECLFDSGIVEMLEQGRGEEVRAYAEAKWPDGYWGGARDLKIMWIPEGTAFLINDYDGFEEIITNESDGWVIA